MRNYKNKTVWITGAGSGIGKATALRFSKEGANLILTDINEESLEKAKEECLVAGAAGAVALKADLGDLDSLPALAERAWKIAGDFSTSLEMTKEKSEMTKEKGERAKEKSERAKEEQPGIDVFYANAGISQRCTTVDADLNVIQRVMNLDYWCPVILTKALLPRMIGRGGGQLAVTSSIAGLFGSKLRCAYCSAKAAVRLFFQTVGVEYYDQGIRTTVLIPGRVKTNISFSALEKGGKAHGKMDKGQAKGITPEKAGDIIYKAIARAKREKLVGGGELLMVWINKFFPGLAFKISRGLEG